MTTPVAVRIRTLLLVAPLLWIWGCATQQQAVGPASDQQWELRRGMLEQIQTWHCNGRISVAVDNDAWSASLQWEQLADAYELRVIAPLGQGTLVLSGQADGRVSLQLDDGRVVHADNPESLLQEALGWSVPVSGMAFWIRGLPDPGRQVEDLQLDAQGRVTRMTQAGWHITYTRYHDLEGLELPGRIRLINGNLRMRLAIRDWQI